ncbi:hypothetical protein SDC9_202278 [bioreactor metagenome]|uniref:Uncharacterized protein n=1 Tax=bioreactor metagenome TaxID=1076179 RepID=A0A645ITW8_9ZZZZ
MDIGQRGIQFFVFNAFQKQVHHFLHLRTDRLLHRGQWRMTEFCETCSVATDDGDVLGNAYLPVGKKPHRSACHIVVGGKNRSDFQLFQGPHHFFETAFDLVQ